MTTFGVLTCPIGQRTGPQAGLRAHRRPARRLGWGVFALLMLALPPAPLMASKLGDWCHMGITGAEDMPVSFSDLPPYLVFTGIKGTTQTLLEAPDATLIDRGDNSITFIAKIFRVMSGPLTGSNKSYSDYDSIYVAAYYTPFLAWTGAHFEFGQFVIFPPWGTLRDKRKLRAVAKIELSGFGGSRVANAEVQFVPNIPGMSEFSMSADPNGHVFIDCFSLDDVTPAISHAFVILSDGTKTDAILTVKNIIFGESRLILSPLKEDDPPPITSGMEIERPK